MIHRIVVMKRSTWTASEREPKGFHKAVTTSWRDSECAAVANLLDPFQLEAPLGQRRTDCAADVWAPLCPVETRTAKHPTLCTRGGKIDAKPCQEFHASRRYFACFVAEYDEIIGHHRIGKVDAQHAGNVVVAGAPRVVFTIGEHIQQPESA